MKTNMLAAIAVVVANSALGCAAQDDAAPSAASADLTSGDVSENIARLQALDIFSVNSLGGYITEGKNCYGSQIPTSIGWECPDEVALLADKVAAGDRRLDAFVAAAEAAAAHSTAQGKPVTAEQDLTALRSLHIVAVGDLILDETESSNCYNNFCVEADRLRAGKLHAIVEATKHLP